ncbi:hypothetical protein [Emticicia sp. BO119]|uniref:hypothetical protein n=1 Tax=Emticicia sp. BO119 TaxID=2757768 RepID=UPI0015F07480|nr:hypothetical protein [Emticicia sp. BO119]MBA4851375.1 hypothetical protein [Emticicia sp. BO119]
MNGYNLTRRWFDWAFENPDLNTPLHTALFMWVVEKWNRLGQKDKFGLPTSEAMEVLSIRSYKTYKKVFNQLIDWGFIAVLQESKNQYTSTIIALSVSDNATDKALDKALTIHTPKQVESISQSINRIDKQESKELKKPLNRETAGTEVSVTGIVSDDAVNPPTVCPRPEQRMDCGNRRPDEKTIDFRTIWNTYDKKIGDRQRCEKKWNALSYKEKWLAWQHIPDYVRSTPDKKYRANLETYLNQKRWNNEIIHNHARPGNKSATAAATSRTAKPFLEKPRSIGGNPIRKNIFGKEETPV